MIAGDFNGHDLTSILDDFNDLKIRHTAPTRGTATLDLALTNFDQNIISSDVLPPLTADITDVDSDHGFISYKATFKHHHNFKWIRYSARVMTDSNIEACVNAINSADFSAAMKGTTNERVEALHEILLDIANVHIPFKTYKRRSTDDPWITDEIRKMIKRRMSVFKREGRRSKNYKALRTKSET